MRYMLLIHGDEKDDLSPGDPGFDEMMTAEIVRVYGTLADVSPTPVVALNRSVAIAMADGPQTALAEMERLGLAEQLDSYQPYHAARADFLRRAGRTNEARKEYLRAIELTTNVAERGFLEGRLRELGGAPPHPRPLSRAGRGE